MLVGLPDAISATGDPSSNLYNFLTLTNIFNNNKIIIFIYRSGLTEPGNAYKFPHPTYNSRLEKATDAKMGIYAVNSK